MKLPLALFCLALAGCVSAPPPTRQVEKVKPLPVALDPDFALRKTKQFFLDPLAAPQPGVDASIAFERSYRSYGTITQLDQRAHYGNYYDFFWRNRRQADVTVRFEYRQDKLHALVQAKEIRYPNIRRGTHDSEFAVIGDDFIADGRVIAWRVSLIVEGRIAATKRSYLWE